MTLCPSNAIIEMCVLFAVFVQIPGDVKHRGDGVLNRDGVVSRAEFQEQQIVLNAAQGIEKRPSHDLAFFLTHRKSLLSRPAVHHPCRRNKYIVLLFFEVVNSIASNFVSLYGESKMYSVFVELLQRNGVSTYQVSKATGIAQSVFSSWKNGVSKPKADKMKKIADYFGVSVDYLLGTEKKDMFPTHLTAPEDVAFVPILGRVPAGVPIAAITDVEGSVDIPAAWTKSAEYFALRIRGSSMEPRIHDGDVVIVRRQDGCDNGDICIVAINGEDATCKRVHTDDSGITLIPLNPAYDPLHFTNRQIAEEPVRIVGKVVEARTRF